MLRQLEEKREEKLVYYGNERMGRIYSMQQKKKKKLSSLSSAAVAPAVATGKTT